MTISSKDVAQGEAVSVQRKVYVEPAVPLNVLALLVVFPKEPPVPLTTDQEPEDPAGAFAAKVTVVKPHVASPV